MQNDGNRFTVRLLPGQLGARSSVRHRPPSARAVSRMVALLMRTPFSNHDAEQQVWLALQLLWYWPSAFPLVSVELHHQRRAQRRQALLLRRRRSRAEAAAIRAARLQQHREQMRQLREAAPLDDEQDQADSSSDP